MTKKVIDIIGVGEIFLERVHRMINEKWMEGRTLKKELEKEEIEKNTQRGRKNTSWAWCCGRKQKKDFQGDKISPQEGQAR